MKEIEIFVISITFVDNISFVALLYNTCFHNFGDCFATVVQLLINTFYVNGNRSQYSDNHDNYDNYDNINHTTNINTNTNNTINTSTNTSTNLINTININTNTNNNNNNMKNAKNTTMKKKTHK